MGEHDDNADALGRSFSKLGLTLDQLGNNLVHMFDVLLSQLSDDEPWPWEHPVDWVLRVGPKKSGHNITPGEAWRYRANMDWWNQRK